MSIRPPHILSRGLRKERPHEVIYFDSESHVIKDVHHPYLICACFVRYRKKAKNSEKWHDFFSENLLDDFWSTVVSFCKDKKTVYMYAHNAGYDVLVTQGILKLCCDHGFRVESIFEKGSVYILTFTNEKKKITVISTTNYYAATLKQLGDIVGLPKLEVEYDTATAEEALTYCRRDVEIIKLAMENMFAFVAREDLGCLAKTIAGQSFNAFRYRFMNDEIFIHDNEKAIALERAAYYGGRVECWHIGVLPTNDNYFKVDVNSMYPYVMKNFKMPYKLVGYTKHNEVSDIQEFIDKGFGVIAKVYIDTDIPYFPYRLKNKLIFPIGKYVTYLASPEIEIALKYGMIKKVKEIAVYEITNIFSDYVAYFYEKRQTAKAAGDKVHDYMYKLLLNSLYGKTGQLSENWERVADAEPWIVKSEFIVDADTGERIYTKTFGGSVFEKGETSEAFHSFPAIAAFVTSYSRVVLANFAFCAGSNNVLYMDTDSLFLREDGFKEIEKAGYIDNKKLGALKLEEISNKVRISAPKDYYFGDTVKLKGVNKSAKEISPTEYLTWNWPKLSSSIQRGDLKEYKNIWRTKILSRRYEKGNVQSDGRVIPFRLSEF